MPQSTVCLNGSIFLLDPCALRYSHAQWRGFHISCSIFLLAWKARTSEQSTLTVSFTAGGSVSVVCPED